MSWTPPTVTQFKTQFERDFNFAPESDPDNLEKITDKDINRAILESQVHFNSDLFGETETIDVIFMYLVAFNLVVNIQNSTKGLSSQSKFPINSNSVGGVSVSFSIPEKVLNSPFCAQYLQNGYGKKYLELAWPFTVGNISVVGGGSPF